MADGIKKIRAELKGEIAEIKVLMSHPMETGTRKDGKTGNPIPAHFINQVVASVNGKPVMEAQWGAAISKDPFLSFKVKGLKLGDKVMINAVDNLGNKFSSETAIEASKA